MLKLFNENEELSIAFNWLLPTIYSNGGEFEINKRHYTNEVWEDQKKQLHLLYCNQLIKYKEFTQDDHILGVLTAKGLKIKEQKINV